MKKFFSNNVDYVSNLIFPSYIDGNDVEIFSIECLTKIFNNVESRFDKQHVTSYLQRNKKIFKIVNFKTSEDLSLKYRVTLDYKEDLIVIKKILSNKNIYLNYKAVVLLDVLSLLFQILLKPLLFYLVPIYLPLIPRQVI